MEAPCVRGAELCPERGQDVADGGCMSLWFPPMICGSMNE
jgi:hypothetical protein